MKRAQRWWSVYWTATIVVVLGLLWTSVVVLRGEWREADRRLHDEHLAGVRLALWPKR